MLRAAGVEFEVVQPSVDESELKAQSSTPDEIARGLAEAKALSVSRPSDWAIGSDSLISVEGRMFGKPGSREQAAEHLRFFSGKTMRLTSAVALATASSVDWRHVESATLHVRNLSESFINAYLNAEWPEVGHCVGVFRLEARGVQLFDSIEGDHFTVLGMPLIPLLGALRQRGLLPA
jgi:septum formation protein